MKYLAPSSWWSIEVPTGWSADYDEDCTTLTADIPLGALQISATRKDAGPITDDELREFAQEHIEAGAKLRPATYGNLSGFGVRYSDEEYSYQEWWLRTGQTMVFITYTVALADSEREELVITATLNTIRAEPEQASA
jgi:hypothetical protein